MAKFAVILPAAGKSTRFRAKQRKKPFVDLKGRAVWLRAADHFVNRDDVVQTLIVVAPEDVDEFKERFAPNLAFMNIEVVLGGSERADSVWNALERVSPEAEFVAVHDAARPLIVPEWITSVFKTAQETGAAILGLPVTSTLKRVGEDGRILATVPRDQLWQAQTPQVFRTDWLREAYQRRGTLQPTDEAQLLEAAGRTVTVVPGSPLNIKLTTAADLDFASAALDALPKPQLFRPIHPFADEEPRFGK